MIQKRAELTILKLLGSGLEVSYYQIVEQCDYLMDYLVDYNISMMSVLYSMFTLEYAVCTEDRYMYTRELVHSLMLSENYHAT